MAKLYIEVLAPREGVNDDTALVVRWLVDDGAHADAGQPIVVLETTKATFDVATPRAGYVFHVASAGSDIAIGTAIAVVSSTPVRPDNPVMGSGLVEPSGQIISQRARELMARHGLQPSQFAGLPAVREADVMAVIGQTPSTAAATGPSGATAVEADQAADAVLGSAKYGEVQELLGALRRRMRIRFNRHVPTGTLLNDRWALARELGFGEGTSVYDESLILGNVTVGKQCWIGPFTILDGSQAQLTIGDYVDIGSGAQIYTHNSIERALTGHRAPLFGNATTIGNCCFIAPNAIIGAGTVLGDHCFVAAGSYVEGTYPACSYIAGDPATVVGRVDVGGGRAKIRRFRRSE